MSTSLNQSTSQTSSVSTSVGASSEKTVSEIQDEKKASTQNESKVDKIDSSILKPATIESNTVKTNSDTTSLVGATAATLSSVETSVKKNEENRKKLSKLSAEMGEYLAKAAGLPNTDSAITKVNAAVTAIEKALADPTSDWTEVVQKATLARNSIVNAVLRAQSGARDARNGQAMLRDSSLRASWASSQNDSRMTVSQPVGSFDKATGIATFTMNVQADSALRNVGVRVNVGRGGHVQSAKFNGNSMEKTYTQGSEIVYNYSHGQSANRNLSGTIEVKVKYDNNVPTATADMQVQVSSAPIGQHTQGNASRVQTASVSTGYSRPQSNNSISKTGPKFNVSSTYKEVYNGDVINDNIGVEYRGSLIKKVSLENRTLIPGIYYGGPQNNQTLNNVKNITVNLAGEIGGSDASAEVGKTYTYNFSAWDNNDTKSTANISYYIKGFNERHNIQSGDIVRVSDLSHLTPEEIKEVYNNFINNDANKRDLLSNQDVVKNGTQPKFILCRKREGDFIISWNQVEN